MWEWITDNAELIVATSAAIISLGSLYVARGALRVQREHNYRSVRPLVHFSWGDYEDNVFVKLQNYGAGPLIIDQFTITNDQSTHKRLIDALGGVASIIDWNNFSDTLDGRALAPNAEYVLLDGSFDDTEEEQRLIIRAALSKMVINITYKDVYDRPQTPVAHQLSWFSR